MAETLPREIKELLCCPQCRGSLSDFNCSSCGENYPPIAGIPWLLASPKTSLGFWKNSYQKSVESLKSQAQGLRVQSEASSNLSTTTKRLRKLSQAKYEQANHFEKLLEGLAKAEVSQQISEGLYPQQNLTSYVDNIHRDWAWGEEENQASLDCLKEAIGDESFNNKTVLFLGAGAGRLAYDFHRFFTPQNTIVTDINPLLLICAQKVISGDKIKLYDFPIAPNDLNSVQTLNKLQAPTKENDIHFLYADALQIPFKRNSIDVIITPWLIDILPGDPELLMRSVNRVLKEEGCWINFGPLGFTHQETRFHYSREEIHEGLQSSQFKLNQEVIREIPYMQNPSSQHSRLENVTCFRATKVANVENKEVQELLPDWLLNTKVPVPKEAHFNNLKATHEISFQVFKEVNGGNSLEEMAKNLSPQFGLKPEETLESLKRFFIRNLP